MSKFDPEGVFSILNETHMKRGRGCVIPARVIQVCRYPSSASLEFALKQLGLASLHDNNYS